MTSVGENEAPDEDLTAVQAAAERLALKIIGEVGFRAGTTLTLQQLQGECGVSRPMAREVAQLLQEKGLIKTRHRVGLVVQPLERWALLDEQVVGWRLQVDYHGQIRSLLELRAAIEPHAARLAAERISAGQRRRLDLLASRLKELGEASTFDDQAFGAADNAYHALLLQATQNELFAAHAHAVRQSLEFRLRLAFPPRPEPVAIYLHVALAAAVNQNNPDAAEAFSAAIIWEVQGRIHESIISKVLEALDPARSTGLMPFQLNDDDRKGLQRALQKSLPDDMSAPDGIARRSAPSSGT